MISKANECESHVVFKQNTRFCCDLNFFIINSINDNFVDQFTCEESNLDWVEGVGCVDSWMYLEEQLEGQDCIDNGYRNLLIENPDTIIVNTCFGTCEEC